MRVISTRSDRRPMPLPIPFSDDVRSSELDLLAFFFFFVIALPLESNVCVLNSTDSLVTRSAFPIGITDRLAIPAHLRSAKKPIPLTIDLRLLKLS